MTDPKLDDEGYTHLYCWLVSIVNTHGLEPDDSWTRRDIFFEGGIGISVENDGESICKNPDVATPKWLLKACEDDAKRLARVTVCDSFTPSGKPRVHTARVKSVTMFHEDAVAYRMMTFIGGRRVLLKHDCDEVAQIIGEDPNDCFAHRGKELWTKLRNAWVQF